MAAIGHLPEVKAGEPGQLVMVSDSFLIDPNIVFEAHRHGVGTIVAPDGSASDDKIIEACQKVGMNLGFTPLKESREFFGHG
jgi:AICAR transformylase/IMP cyclohydrolase PurH